MARETLMSYGFQQAPDGMWFLPHPLYTCSEEGCSSCYRLLLAATALPLAISVAVLNQSFLTNVFCIVLFQMLSSHLCVQLLLLLYTLCVMLLLHTLSVVHTIMQICISIYTTEKSMFALQDAHIWRAKCITMR